jgi:hypothetical protein
VPCPGGSGDFAGGCHVGLLSLVCVAGGFVSVVSEGTAGGEGLTLEIVIKIVLCEKSAPTVPPAAPTTGESHRENPDLSGIPEGMVSMA